MQSSPAQVGSWYWMSDTEVHWRPKSYWKPGTEVTVDADVNGVNAGNGIFGQEDREASFTVGDSLFMNIDVQAHTMKVVRNGQLLRTIPISAGKPGFTTRSGVKVIIEKFESKRMDAATTGISESDPEYYNLSNVQYAQRVTYSGEFIHAAPWSVGSQGSANVSHGCVGMSTENAGWLYSLTQRGDVVDVTGTDRAMELVQRLRRLEPLLGRLPRRLRPLTPRPLARRRCGTRETSLRYARDGAAVRARRRCGTRETALRYA